MTIKNLSILASVVKRPDNPPFYYFSIPDDAANVFFQILIPKEDPLYCRSEDDGVTYDPDDWTPVPVWDLRYGKVFVGAENIPTYVGDKFVYNIAYTREALVDEDESLRQELKELKEAVGKLIPPYPNPIITWVTPKT